jgi:hypothetical protein
MSTREGGGADVPVIFSIYFSAFSLLPDIICMHVISREGCTNSLHLNGAISFIDTSP